MDWEGTLLDTPLASLTGKLTALSTADLSTVTEDGKNVLHVAAELRLVGAIPCVLMASMGRSLDLQHQLDADGFSPLHTACMVGNPAVVNAFIAAGSDVNSRTIIGATPLMLAITCKQDAVVDALLAHGNKLEINATDDDGWNAVIRAALGDQADVLERLIELGADLSLYDLSGLNALHHACSSGSCNAVTTLLAAGMDVNAITNDGDTPLLLAALSGDVESCAALCEHGADVSAANHEHHTALDVATRNGNNPLVTLLNQALQSQASDA